MECFKLFRLLLDSDHDNMLSVASRFPSGSLNEFTVIPKIFTNLYTHSNDVQPDYLLTRMSKKDHTNTNALFPWVEFLGEFFVSPKGIGYLLLCLFI